MSVQQGVTICPVCGAKLKYFDKTDRVVRGEYGTKKKIKIWRLKCTGCGKIHREQPKNMFPYVQFRADIYQGVIEGTISFYDLEYEDYPCEETMRRWRRKHEQK